MSYDTSEIRGDSQVRLKGHQIIGELRQVARSGATRTVDWKVTRSLVSYDYCNHNNNNNKLKGHQIIGELRLYPLQQLLSNQLLKGHQIIGELRLTKRSMSFALHILKGHQIIGELRRTFQFGINLANIERSPDHWWVTTMYCVLCKQKQTIERSPDHWWVTTRNPL